MIDRTTQYAEDVLSGDIVACKRVIQACQRHLDDLKRSKDDFPYFFNVKKANEIHEFAETLFIAEGHGEKEKLELAGFQAFIFGSLWGWVEKDTGYRRFRTSYVQVGRQNSKSFMNSVIGMKGGNFDGYNYPQIYCTATKMDQAKIVLKEIIKFIEADSDLEELFTVQEYKGEVLCNLTGGVIRALGRDTKSIDGFRPYIGIVDEYHAHKDNQMYKLLEGGTGNLNQSLISIITTAGFDLNGPCYEEYEYSCNLLDGVFENERQFVFIAELDKEDDIWNPDNWIKANPLTCRTEQGIKNMKEIAKKAKDKGGQDLVDFITKRCNRWYQFSDDQYMSIDDWKACATDLTLDDFRGQDCIIGLDLSSGGDLTSLSVEVPYREDDNDKYFIHSHSFIPRNRVQEHIKTDRVPYDLWINQDLLTVTETLGGVKTDYKYIISYLKSLIEEYDLNMQCIAYDPYNSNAFLGDLEEFGVDLIEVRQSARNLSDATEDFKLEVKARNITFNKDNHLLTWSMANAKTESNSFGEVKIVKQDKNNRIDPVDAVIDSHKVAMQNLYGNLNLDEYVTDEYLDELGW